MGTMEIHCRKWHSVASPRCILPPQLVSSVVFATKKPVGPISTSSAPDSFFSLTNFLVGSLGFSENQALFTSSKLTKLRQSRGATEVCGTNFLNNADSVVSFLHQKGFDEPQIRNLVYSLPQILACRIEQTLEPKIIFLQQLGLSVSDIVAVVLKNPEILYSGLDSAIRPAVEALRVIMGSDDDVIRVIMKCRHYSLNPGIKRIVDNVSSLQDQGIPIESIRTNLLRQPSSFFIRPQVFKDKMAQAEEEWGVSPKSSRFLPAIHILTGLNEKTMESKCQVFESFGWKRSDLVELFRRDPSTLGASEEMIRTRLSFFMNKLGYSPLYIATRPDLMIYSFKKRVLPRHLVLKFLKEKGLFRKKMSLYTAIRMTESRFLEKFIQPFENDEPNLFNIYIDKLKEEEALVWTSC